MRTKIKQITKTENRKTYQLRFGLWVETTESFLTRGGFIQVYHQNGTNLFDCYRRSREGKNIVLLKTA